MDALRRLPHGRLAPAGLALAAAAALWLSAPAPTHAERAYATQAIRVRVVAGLGWHACRQAGRCAAGSGRWAVARRERTVTLNSVRSGFGRGN